MTIIIKQNEFKLRMIRECKTNWTLSHLLSILFLTELTLENKWIE